MKKILILLLASLAGSLGLGAAPQQASDPQVEKVLVIFKTHLDIGFTDLSSKVEQSYIDYYIPKAIEVARRLREGAKLSNSDVRRVTSATSGRPAPGSSMPICGRQRPRPQPNSRKPSAAATSCGTAFPTRSSRNR